jgi:hypothetical protein
VTQSAPAFRFSLISFLLFAPRQIPEERLGGHSEVERNCGLHLDRLPLQHARLESPLLHSSDGSISQQGLAADQLYILNCAVATDSHLQHYCSLNPLLPSFLGIFRFDPMEQAAIRRVRRQLNNSRWF